MQGEFLTNFYVNADKYFRAKIAKTEKEEKPDCNSSYEL